MRMWMVDPKIMCRNHLLGEHRELHAIAGLIRKKKSLDGYLSEGLIDPRLLQSRHLALSKEMSQRGYYDAESIGVLDLSYLRLEDRPYVDAEESLRILLSRCSACTERHQKGDKQ